MPLSTQERRNIGLTSLANNLLARERGTAMESTEAKLMAAERLRAGEEAQTLSNTLHKSQLEREKTVAMIEAKKEVVVKEILKDKTLTAIQKYNKLMALGGSAADRAMGMMKKATEFKKSQMAPDPQIAENRRLEGVLKQQQIDKANAPASAPDPLKGLSAGAADYLYFDKHPEIGKKYYAYLEKVAATKKPLVEIHQGAKLPTGYMWANEEHTAVTPIKGSPGEQKQVADKENRIIKETRVREAAKTVVTDTQRAIDVLEEWGPLASGASAMVSSWLPPTPAGQVEKLIDSLRGNVGIDALLKIKADGATLGQIPHAQMGMLADTMGKLDVNMRSKDLLFNLKRLQKVYTEMVRMNGGKKPDFEARATELGLQPPRETSSEPPPPDASIDELIRYYTPVQ